MTTKQARRSQQFQLRW